jgi:hypothetical protein
MSASNAETGFTLQIFDIIFYLLILCSQKYENL